MVTTRHGGGRLTAAQRSLVLLLVIAVVCNAALLVCPARVVASPTTITLSGWGWCVAYRDIGNVSLVLDGSSIPRENATDIQDLYLTGTLTFNLDDRSDQFELELRGTRVRSLFFLQQVSGGETPLIAEFEGTWLSETDYVVCEGRIAVPVPDHVAKPYFFVLRTADAEPPSRSEGSWVADLDFIIGGLTSAANVMADRLSTGGSVIKQNLGDLLTKAAFIVMKIRDLGTPYFT